MHTTMVEMTRHNIEEFPWNFRFKVGELVAISKHEHNPPTSYGGTRILSQVFIPAVITGIVEIKYKSNNGFCEVLKIEYLHNQSLHTCSSDQVCDISFYITQQEQQTLSGSEQKT